jgi:hypothetical protein
VILAFYVSSLSLRSELRALALTLDVARARERAPNGERSEP